MAHILIVDDDIAICKTLSLHFVQLGHRVSQAHSAEEGLSVALESNVDAIISDIRLPGQDGLALLRDIKTRRPSLPVIMITAFHDLELTVAAMQGGASDYVAKPIDLGELDAAIERVTAKNRNQHGDALVLGPPEIGRSQIIGQSMAMMEVFKNIGHVAQSRVSVLITGESGTGKELVARAIHNLSAESRLPFVAVNCAALVENLLESELFGHERGAFTGAVSAHKGKIEQVGEGTLFLDEIAELSAAMQGKLLRILEEREYSPLGSTQVKKCHARFIAATNVDLKERVETGAFRLDLFYRLNVVNIHLPPLRDRRSDIPLLIDFLLKKINHDLKKNIRRVSSDVVSCLMAYPWPGNVRQLNNVLMKTAVMESGDELTISRLPSEITCAHDRIDSASELGMTPPRLTLEELERRYIERVLGETGWHKGNTCKILGISRPTLERKIRDYALLPQVPMKDD